VAVVARRKDLLDSLVTEIEGAGGRALAVQCDVTNLAEVVAAVKKVENTLGPIDRLIANVGGGKRTHVDTFQSSHIRDVMTLNVVATSNCIEAVLPGMLDRAAGHIVATGSLACYRGLPQAAAYSAAKAAITNMMESLRIDLRPRGIDVTLLLPGFVRTNPLSKKKRPFEMELEEATTRMIRAIERRNSRYAFPLPLTALFGIGRLLPSPLYDRLLTGRGKKPKKIDAAKRQQDT
jgi:short-subunit dehydrogenase